MHIAHSRIIMHKIWLHCNRYYVREAVIYVLVDFCPLRGGGGTPQFHEGKNPSFFHTDFPLRGWGGYPLNGQNPLKRK